MPIGSTAALSRLVMVLVSKTVAYGKITDADMEEPKGKSGPCCCMIPNFLTHVHIKTASSGGTYVNEHGQTVTQHELSIAGIVDPHGFKADIWSMIRGDGVDGAGASQTAVWHPIMKGGGVGEERHGAHGRAHGHA